MGKGRRREKEIPGAISSSTPFLPLPSPTAEEEEEEVCYDYVGWDRRKGGRRAEAPTS